MGTLRATFDRSLQQFLQSGDAVLPVREPLVLFVCAVSAAAWIHSGEGDSQRKVRKTDLIVADETHPGAVLRVWDRPVGPDLASAGDIILLTGASTRVWRGTSTLSAGSGAWVCRLAPAGSLASSGGGSTGAGVASAGPIAPPELVIIREQLGPWGGRNPEALATAVGSRAAAVRSWARADPTARAVLQAVSGAAYLEAEPPSAGSGVAPSPAVPSSSSCTPVAASGSGGAAKGVANHHRSPARQPVLPALPPAAAGAASIPVLPPPPLPARLQDAAWLVAPTQQGRSAGAGARGVFPASPRTLTVEVSVLTVIPAAAAAPGASMGGRPGAVLHGLATVVLPATPTVPVQLRVYGPETGTSVLLQQLTALASSEAGRGTVVVLGPLELVALEGGGGYPGSAPPPVLCTNADTKVVATRLRAPPSAVGFVPTDSGSAPALPPLPPGLHLPAPDPTLGLIGEAPLTWAEAVARLQAPPASPPSPLSLDVSEPVTFRAALRSIVVPSAGVGIGAALTALAPSKLPLPPPTAAAAAADSSAARPWGLCVSQALLPPAPSSGAAPPSMSSAATLTMPEDLHAATPSFSAYMPSPVSGSTLAASVGLTGLQPLVCAAHAARCLTARLPPPWDDACAQGGEEHVFVPLLLELQPVAQPPLLPGASFGTGLDSQTTQLLPEPSSAAASSSLPTPGRGAAAASMGSPSVPSSLWVLVDDSALVSRGLLGGLDPALLAASAAGEGVDDDDVVMINSNGNSNASLAAAVLQTLYACVAGPAPTKQVFTVSALRRAVGEAGPRPAALAPTQGGPSVLFAAGLYPEL